MSQRDLSWVKFWPIVTEFLVQMKELKSATDSFSSSGIATSCHDFSVLHFRTPSASSRPMAWSICPRAPRSLHDFAVLGSFTDLVYTTSFSSKLRRFSICHRPGGLKRAKVTLLGLRFGTHPYSHHLIFILFLFRFPYNAAMLHVNPLYTMFPPQQILGARAFWISRFQFDISYPPRECNMT